MYRCVKNFCNEVSVVDGGMRTRRCIVHCVLVQGLYCSLCTRTCVVDMYPSVLCVMNIC